MEMLHPSGTVMALPLIVTVDTFALPIFIDIIEAPSLVVLGSPHRMPHPPQKYRLCDHGE